jgi:hypothetical protein
MQCAAFRMLSCIVARYLHQDDHHDLDWIVPADSAVTLLLVAQNAQHHKQLARPKGQVCATGVKAVVQDLQ